MDIHRFTVGQTVRLLQSVVNRSKSMRCQVMQVMPFDGVCFQYRVRGEDERFDRIAQQHELAEIAPQLDETADHRHSEQAEKLFSLPTHAMKGKV
jgi:hypothetical protein